jgi:hypothetical protein
MAEENAATTVETPAAAPEPMDRAALESKVSESLEKFFGEPADEPEAPAADDSADSSEVTEDEDQVEEKTEEQEVTEDKTEQQEVKAAAVEPKKGDAPTLPAAYRRSLLATEWTEEEIDQAHASGGQAFIATAAKIHATRTSEVQRWADEGRRRREEQAKATLEQPKVFEPLKALDTAELEKEFGKDAMIEKVVGPVNRVIEVLNAMFPKVAEYEQNAQKAETEILGKQIEAFFDADDRKPYREMFGGGETEFTDEIIKNRNEMLDYADALIGGAEAMGKKLTLGKALELAFDASSGKFKEKAAVKKITTTLKKREKGMTLKPGNKKPVPVSDPSKPKSRADLEKQVTSKLKAMFA